MKKFRLGLSTIGIGISMLAWICVACAGDIAECNGGGCDRNGAALDVRSHQKESGTIQGAKIHKSGKLELAGNSNGDILVEKGGALVVSGMVNGTIVNQGGQVTVNGIAHRVQNSSGKTKINGTVDEVVVEHGVVTIPGTVNGTIVNRSGRVIVDGTARKIESSGGRIDVNGTVNEVTATGGRGYKDGSQMYSISGNGWAHMVTTSGNIDNSSLQQPQPGMAPQQTQTSAHDQYGRDLRSCLQTISYKDSSTGPLAQWQNTCNETIYIDYWRVVVTNMYTGETEGRYDQLYLDPGATVIPDIFTGAPKSQGEIAVCPKHYQAMGSDGNRWVTTHSKEYRCKYSPRSDDPE